jgi:hypothetical protein
MKHRLFVALTALTALAAARNASAQGCVLIREAAPVIGSSSSTYLRPGEWQLDVSYRDSTATRHYSLDVEQTQREILGTYVRNTQKQTVFNLNHSLTERFSFGITVPIVVATWGIPRPLTPVPGERATEHGQGLGDISAMGRMWLLDTQTHRSRNFSIGLGFKAPTGNGNQYDVYNDNNGVNPTSKPIDQSIEPGDGGWGAQVELQGFTRIGRAFVFGSANYLLNPKDVNDAPSGRAAGQYQRDFNSVPDQYVVRAGVGAPVWRNIGASVAYRVEGVPRYDAIGRSDGFRRPGQERYIEPGVTFTTGRSTLQFNIPIGVYRYRGPDPYTGANGDATFPDWVALGSFSYRFGSVKHKAMPASPVLPGTRQDG